MTLEIAILIGRVAIIASLYAFLAALFLFLWRDLRASAGALPVSPSQHGSLVVLDGDEHGLAAGDTLELQPVTTIGRGRASTIVIPDPFASAIHAAVLLRGGRWWLEDRQSRNGTLLNDVRLEQPVILSSGDEISIGQVRFQFIDETRERIAPPPQQEVHDV